MGFDVEYLEGAVEFLLGLEPKVRRKIALNIEKAKFDID